MKKIWVWVLFCLSTGQSYGFIYDLIVVRRWMSDMNRYQFCIGFCDFHDKKHIINKNQLSSLEDFFLSCRQSALQLLTEDLSSAGCGGRKGCGNFVIDSHGGILGGLAAWCRKIGLEVNNVEYRYCRVIAFAPIMHALNANLSVDIPCIGFGSFPSVQQISIAHLLQEIMEVVEEVHAYKDGASLSLWYKALLQNVYEHIKKLKLSENKDLSVAHYLMTHFHPTGDRKALLKELLMFDSNLLDAKLLHNIVSSSKPYVAVFAGGSHIDRVMEILKKNGYEQVYHTGVQWYRDVNSIKKNSMHQEPKPVSPRSLHYVLKTVTLNKNF